MTPRSAGGLGVGLPPGSRIGRYEIVAPIASGGMAVVYLARATAAGGFRKAVAVKVVHEFMASSELAMELLEEAKLSARIQHPHVVQVLDAGEEDGRAYLVMEYVAGDTLQGIQRHLRKRSQEIEDGIALKILDDAFAGLEAAHAIRDVNDGAPIHLVHRDVSPQNILVGIDGLARLGDFGIAKAASRQGHTKTGLTKGKIGYMAPEQIRGAKLDARADVWASGVVAWEIFARRRLFRADEDIAVAMQIVERPPERLKTVRPDLPIELDEALAWALTQDIDERCPSIAELREALDRVAQKMGRADARAVGALVDRLVGSELQKREREVSALVPILSPAPASLRERSAAQEEHVATASMEMPLQIAGGATDNAVTVPDALVMAPPSPAKMASSSRRPMQIAIGTTIVLVAIGSAALGASYARKQDDKKKDDGVTQTAAPPAELTPSSPPDPIESAAVVATPTAPSTGAAASNSNHGTRRPPQRPPSTRPSSGLMPNPYAGKK